MAAVNGSRSVFPGAIDDWGSAFQNNVCQIVDAEWFNKIEDAVFNVEVKSRRSFITGKSGVLTPAVSGVARPHVMFKAFTVTVTGTATTQTVFIPGPVFNANELAMFPTPFASGNLVHVQIRKVPGDAYSLVAYHCGLLRPIDTTGNSGLYLVASTLRHGDGDFVIPAGTYVVSLMVTGN